MNRLLNQLLILLVGIFSVYANAKSVESVPGAVVPTIAQIVDSNGAIYKLVATRARGNRVSLNGKLLAQTPNTVLLLYLNGSVYREDSSNVFYIYVKSAWSKVTDPRVTSATNTFVPSAKYLIDSHKNVYALVASASMGNQIAVNGVVDAITQQVTSLFYLNEQVYQSNSTGSYYEKETSGWVQVSNPIAPQPSPSPAPVLAPSPSPSPVGTTAGSSGASENYQCASGQICYYIDSANGNDGNVGNTPTAPWKSLAKTNNLSLKAGSAILLRSGSVFNNQKITLISSGSSGAPIVVTSYGSGAQPVISGSNYGIYGWQLNYVSILGIHFTAISDSAIVSDYAGSNWKVSNCTFDNFSNVAIRAFTNPSGKGNSAGWIVSNNTIGLAKTANVINYDAGGIVLRDTAGAQITRNKIATVNALAIRIDAQVGASSPTIAYNEILRNYSGITVWNADNAVIVHNYIHDSNGCALCIASQSGTLIMYNLIQNIAIAADNVDYNGIDINGGGINGKIYHNTIENVAFHSITFEGDGNKPSTGWDVRNNILDSRRQGSINNDSGMFFNVTPPSSETFVNDIILANQNPGGIVAQYWPQTGADNWFTPTLFISSVVNSGLIFNLDPNFTNVENEDLSLKAGSPAIGAGVVISGVGQINRDIGALPYGMTSVFGF